MNEGSLSGIDRLADENQIKVIHFKVVAREFGLSYLFSAGHYIISPLGGDNLILTLNIELSGNTVSGLPHPGEYQCLFVIILAFTALVLEGNTLVQLTFALCVCSKYWSALLSNLTSLNKENL